MNWGIVMLRSESKLSVHDTRLIAVAMNLPGALVAFF